MDVLSRQPFGPMMRLLSVAAIASVIALAGSASAAVVTQGFTYAVATAGGASTTGDHFHSNTGGSFGNPAGKAEVGSFGSEQVRGLSEYDLAGLVSGPAFVTFHVFNDGGLFSGSNDFPFVGNIDVFAYAGNNSEDISDYQAASIGFVTTFSTAGLLVGDTISFDISAIFNQALLDSLPSLGIRLQISPATVTGGGAWTFDDFRLTSDDQSTNPAVPEPMSIVVWGLLGSVALIGGYSRHAIAVRKTEN